jgi:septal ring factor EnvC (AmiA/AmiB activator)
MYSILAVIIGALITAALTYYGVRRNSSGDIDTSDAATLWAESQAMRKELRDEVVSLRKELGDVKTDLVRAERDNEISHQKILKLIGRVKQLESQVKKLGGKI